MDTLYYTLNIFENAFPELLQEKSRKFTPELMRENLIQKNISFAKGLCLL